VVDYDAWVDADQFTGADVRDNVADEITFPSELQGMTSNVTFESLRWRENSASVEVVDERTV
jgi:hypothetical protein